MSVDQTELKILNGTNIEKNCEKTELKTEIENGKMFWNKYLNKLVPEEDPVEGWNMLYK